MKPFHTKVHAPTPLECWEWTGHKNAGGYGSVTAIPLGGTGMMLAHRAAWEHAFGSIPSGRCVLHMCDNPACCNPTHLQLGTQRDNIKDMDAKGRRRVGRGVNHTNAKLTEADVKEMRKLRAQGWTYEKLKSHYGLASKNTVHNVCNHKTWKHIN